MSEDSWMRPFPRTKAEARAEARSEMAGRRYRVYETIGPTWHYEIYVPMDAPEHRFTINLMYYDK
jgi:hypothetical protein